MAIEKSTVLVLGAGASVDFNFPPGIRLRNLVCDAASRSAEREILQSLGHPHSDIEAFCHELRFSGYRSVDVFLEHNPEFMAIGKRLIAATLLPFEEETYLFPPHAPESSWYEYLANSMGAGTSAWAKNKLSVITFNYDRSFEHYFTKIIAQRRRVTVEKAYDELVERVRIVHVHGSLGDYPSGLAYGSSLGAESVDAAARRVLVVSEVEDTLPTFLEASALLHAAERIGFLGFGFHPDNVRRLGYFSQTFSEQLAVVDGTMQGFTDREWQEICSTSLNGHWRGRTYSSAYDYLRYHDGLA